MALLGATGLRTAVLLGGGSVAVAGAVATWAVFAPVSTVTIPESGTQIAADGGLRLSEPGSGTGARSDATVASDTRGDAGVQGVPTVPAAVPAAIPVADPGEPAPVTQDAAAASATGSAGPADVASTDAASTDGDPAASPEARSASLDAAVASPPLPVPADLASPPAFDVVRVEPDGAALVAGRAAPGALVSILVDGAAVAQAEADADGRFVALLDLPASPQPRLLTLIAAGAAGAPVPGAERVALGPTTPALGASAAPAAAEASVANTAVIPDAPPSPVADPVAVEGIAGNGNETTSASPPAAVLPVVVADSVGQPAAALSPPAPSPTALLLSDAGARVLEVAPASGTLPDVSIDVISYTVGGEVLLSGRAGEGIVRLYLDNRAVQDVAVERGGWSALLADTAPGLYTLRADGLAADGSVTARFETPFKRETRAALAAVLGQAILPTVTGSPVRIAGSVVDAATTVATDAKTALSGGTATDAEVPAPAATIAGGDAPVAAPVALSASDTAVTAAATSAEPVDGVAAVVASPAVLAEVAAAPVPIAAAMSVTVQPGFTLWGIAEERFGSGMLYVQVFEANRAAIRDPDLIYPGQIFTLPDGG